MSSEFPSDTNMPPFIHEQEASEFIDAVQDPVTKKLLILVASQRIAHLLEGKQPAGQFDLLYCYRLLYEAFNFKQSLHRALGGRDVENPIETEEEWIKGYFGLKPRNESRSGES